MHQTTAALYNNILNGGAISSANANEYRQRRIFNIVMLCVIFICLFFSWRSATFDTWFRVYTLGSGAVLCTLGMLLLRSLGPTSVTLYIGTTGCFIAAFFSTYSSGGVTNIATGWLFTIPLIGGLVGGIQLGRFWSFVVLGGLLLLWVMDKKGSGLINMTPEHLRYGQDRLHQIGQWLIISVSMMSYVKEVSSFREKLDSNIITLEKEIVQRKAEEQKAIESNRVKGEFLTSMTHELRTPLNSILGFSQQLYLRWSNPKMTTDKRDLIAIESINKNGESLLLFINKLIDISKLDDGEVELKTHLFSLTDLFTKLNNDHLPQAEEKQLSLHFTMDTPLLVKADLNIIKEVLNQLISNAIQHTQQGQVCIEAAIEKVSGEEAQKQPAILNMTVTDTGPGIKPEAMEHLFEPYTNMTEGGRGSLKASGLSLALCARLTHLHGGDICVNTERNQGSCFIVKIPLEEPSA